MSVFIAFMLTGILSAQVPDSVDRVLADIKQLVTAGKYDEALQKTLVLRSAIEAKRPKPVNELDSWTKWGNRSTADKLFAVLSKFNVEIKFLADRCLQATSMAGLVGIEADWKKTMRLFLEALKVIESSDRNWKMAVSNDVMRRLKKEDMDAADNKNDLDNLIRKTRQRLEVK